LLDVPGVLLPAFLASSFEDTRMDLARAMLVLLTVI
jgi:hypothetical protein